MNKPDYISKPDWDILNNKYSEKTLIKYLNNDYPYQYLIGNVEFYNSTIIVNGDVLIPRWETEELVNRVVIKLNEANYKPHKGLDICTGSGCIAISLSKAFNIEFDAIDNSKKALAVAKKNSLTNNANINVIRADVLTDDIKGTYDVIISNPPYVSFDEEVGKETKYEPQSAIFADHKGLLFYEVLLKKIKEHTDNKYFIAMEIGPSLKDDIRKIAEDNYKDSKIYFEKDLNDRDRYLFITNIE